MKNVRRKRARGHYEMTDKAWFYGVSRYELVHNQFGKPQKHIETKCNLYNLYINGFINRQKSRKQASFESMLIVEARKQDYLDRQKRMKPCRR